MVLAPPPARLSIAPFFPPLLRRMICFLRHRPWYLLLIPPSPKPVVQLLVGNRHTQLPPTPRHRLAYRPKPLPVAFALGPASMPALPHCPTDASPLPLTPPPHTTSPIAHMRHAHQLFHSLQSLPSPQHPQRLPSLGYPSIHFLLVKLVKHFCWMLPSYLQGSCHT